MHVAHGRVLKRHFLVYCAMHGLVGYSDITGAGLFMFVRFELKFEILVDGCEFSTRYTIWRPIGANCTLSGHHYNLVAIFRENALRYM